MTTPPDPFTPPPGGDGYGPPPRTGQPAYGQPPGYGQPPPPYGSPSGYGQPPAVWGPPGAGGGPPQTHSKAIIALILAIGSFVLFPLLLAIIALVLASSASKEIAASGGRLTGDGLVTAAKVISWINIGLSVLAVVLLVAAFGLLASPGFT